MSACPNRLVCAATPAGFSQTITSSSSYKIFMFMSDDLLRYSMAFLLFLSSLVHCSMILLFGLLLRRFEWMLLFIFLVLIIFKILLFYPLHFLMLVWYNIPKHILQNLCGWWAICILGSTRLSKTIGVIHFVSMLLLPINQFKSRRRLWILFYRNWSSCCEA